MIWRSSLRRSPQQTLQLFSVSTNQLSRLKGLDDFSAIYHPRGQSRNASSNSLNTGLRQRTNQGKTGHKVRLVNRDLLTSMSTEFEGQECSDHRPRSFRIHSIKKIIPYCHVYDPIWKHIAVLKYNERTYHVSVVHTVCNLSMSQ